MPKKEIKGKQKYIELEFRLKIAGVMNGCDRDRTRRILVFALNSLTKRIED